MSKADVSIGGRRLLDHVVAGVHPLVSRRIAAVAPDSVDVPPGMLRTLEDPSAGGPLAGIDAGLRTLDAPAAPIRAATPTRAAVPADSPRGAPGSVALADGSAGEPSAVAQDMVFVLAVDMPQAGALAPRLATATCDRDGAVVVDGGPPFRQCLQVTYRIETLRVAIGEARGPRNKGVRRTLTDSDLAEVSFSADECRDVDTPEDVLWWSEALGSADSGVALRGLGP